MKSRNNGNKIKMLIMDVDGTLTDGKIYISNSGEETKAFNVKDGYAIKEILPKLDITPVIITGRESKIVEIRAKELNITEVYQKVNNKLDLMEELKIKYNLLDENIAVIGDDFNDEALFDVCGFKACPNDAIHIIKEKSDFICKGNGGCGAVQEVILELLTSGLQTY